MNETPQYWYDAGRKDRESGNDAPAVTREDFFREIEDPTTAKACADAYVRGFNNNT